MQTHQEWKVLFNLNIKLLKGKCLIIARPKGNAGKIILKAEGEGLEKGEVVIETEIKF